MKEMTEKEVEVVSGAGIWILLAEVATVYDAATDFAEGFWQGAKQAYGIK